MRCESVLSLPAVECDLRLPRIYFGIVFRPTARSTG